jgi:hypothetical protein
MPPGFSSLVAEHMSEKDFVLMISIGRDVPRGTA